jgi:hypothetical protein
MAHEQAISRREAAMERAPVSKVVGATARSEMRAVPLTRFS